MGGVAPSSNLARYFSNRASLAARLAALVLAATFITLLRFAARPGGLVRHILTAVGVVVLFVAVIGAQGRSSSNDVLPALLAEVRQLRVVMERAMFTGPQVQLLTGRLAVQDQRIARLSRDVISLREQIGRVAVQRDERAAEGRVLEETLAREVDREKRENFEGYLRHNTVRAQSLTAEDQALRVRLIEAENALSVAEAEWGDLIRKLEELGRGLGLVQ